MIYNRANVSYNFLANENDFKDTGKALTTEYNAIEIEQRLYQKEQKQFIETEHTKKRENK